MNSPIIPDFDGGKPPFSRILSQKCPLRLLKSLKPPYALDKVPPGAWGNT